MRELFKVLQQSYDDSRELVPPLDPVQGEYHAEWCIKQLSSRAMRTGCGAILLTTVGPLGLKTAWQTDDEHTQLALAFSVGDASQDQP